MRATVEPGAAVETPERKLARLSFAFLLDEMGNGVAGLDPLDALLVLAINQANIAPLTRDPAARARYGQLEAPAPDDERRPVSINAVAASLGLPFETVRRRIRRLAAAGVCTVSAEGVVVPASFLASPAYLQSVLVGHFRLKDFYFELLAAGLTGELPASSYELEDDIPMRAAARLLADYVLRTSEGLMREAGNVISTMILTALLAHALRETPAPLSVKGAAARLKLPPETVRRHLVQMAEDGLCLRTPAGAAMTPEILSRPGFVALFADNAKHVQRLLVGLAERGVILSWQAPGAAAGLGAA
jgi:DNA-binding transcriptional ArsR family regulator